MKRRIRLLCIGAAVSLLSVHTAFAVEMVPPNPLSGEGVVSSGENAVQGGNPVNAAPGGSNVSVVGDPLAGAQNPSAQNPSAAVSEPSAGTPDASVGIPGPSIGMPSAGNGVLPDAQESTLPAANNGYSSALEGTTFAGSAQVAAPVVQAQGAVLFNCGTGQILFDKNARTPLFPASITKIMTALLTVENCSLDDVVTFSRTATTNLESGAVTLNLTEGDQLTVRDSLYALLLKSANEVANGLAEHMAGSVDNFANMMNARAAQLGCTGTHFANPNGLNNPQHLTTPYDMALIARAAYANPIISQISTTTAYQMPATKLGAAKTITMGHKMLYSTDSRYYPGMLGGKTGYTSKAGNTLVTCVERDGVRLIAVVMKANGTHYTDTKALLDYGFALAANGEIEAGYAAYAGTAAR